MREVEVDGRTPTKTTENLLSLMSTSMPSSPREGQGQGDSLLQKYLSVGSALNSKENELNENELDVKRKGRNNKTITVNNVYAVTHTRKSPRNSIRRKNDDNDYDHEDENEDEQSTNCKPMAEGDGRSRSGIIKPTSSTTLILAKVCPHVEIVRKEKCQLKFKNPGDVHSGPLYLHHDAKHCFAGNIHIKNITTFPNINQVPLFYKIRTTAPEKFQVTPTLGLIPPGVEVTPEIIVIPGTVLHSISTEKFQVLVMIAPRRLLQEQMTWGEGASVSPNSNDHHHHEKSKGQGHGHGHGTNCTPTKSPPFSVPEALNKLWTEFVSEGARVESHKIDLVLNEDLLEAHNYVFVRPSFECETESHSQYKPKPKSNCKSKETPKVGADAKKLFQLHNNNNNIKTCSKPPTIPPPQASPPKRKSLTEKFAHAVRNPPPTITKVLEPQPPRKVQEPHVLPKEKEKEKDCPRCECSKLLVSQLERIEGCVAKMETNMTFKFCKLKKYTLSSLVIAVLSILIVFLSIVFHNCGGVGDSELAGGVCDKSHSTQGQGPSQSQSQQVESESDFPIIKQFVRWGNLM